MKVLREVAALAGFGRDSAQTDQHKILARILLTNIFAHRYSPPLGLPNLEEAGAVVHKVLASGIDAEDGEDAHFDFLIHKILRQCTGRSFYKTENEICGLASMAAEQGDLVTILLGCDYPMVLRPTGEGTYKVVGDAYCDGFMQGEALLGPLPEHFVAVMRRRQRTAASSFYGWEYLNQTTGNFQIEDPRLGALPPGWSIQSHEDEEYLQLFLDEESGLETWDDPRLTSEALGKRGIPLQVFELV